MATKEPPPEGFTDRLREAMRLAEVNQRELARRLHVHEGTVSKWFGSPSQAPSLKVLARIPRALPRTSVDWLLSVPEAEAPPAQRPRPELVRAIARLTKKLDEVGDASAAVAALMPQDEKR